MDLNETYPNSDDASGSGPPGSVVVPTSQAFERWIQRLEKRLIRRIEEVVRSSESRDVEEPYIEPGPNSPRKYFTPKELVDRWTWGKTKVYQIPENELPYWKRGQHKLYFWAHVLAFEGRMSWERANELHEQYQRDNAL